MPQIISAISGMKLESGFAYRCSEPQPDIGRTSQTHIHDSTEIFFLMSFTAPSWTIATCPTNVMQIRCVAMPSLHTHRSTHPHTHTADSCSHGSSNSGWKQCTAPALMGSKEDYGPKLLHVVNHFLHLPFPIARDRRHPHRPRTSFGWAILTHLKDRNWHNGLSTWGPRWNPGHKTGESFL